MRDTVLATETPCFSVLPELRLTCYRLEEYESYENQ